MTTGKMRDLAERYFAGEMSDSMLALFVLDGLARSKDEFNKVVNLALQDYIEDHEEGCLGTRRVWSPYSWVREPSRSIAAWYRCSHCGTSGRTYWAAAMLPERARIYFFGDDPGEGGVADEDS